MTQILIALACAVVLFLFCYACLLWNKVRLQNLRRKLQISQRLEHTVESIRVIALAMEQQQCNLSEGCIRLVRLLESLPLEHTSRLSSQYNGIYTLYHEVKDLPTHARRNQLSRAERNRQDMMREEKEAEYSTVIMSDVATLKSFSLHSKFD